MGELVGDEVGCYAEESLHVLVFEGVQLGVLLLEQLEVLIVDFDFIVARQVKGFLAVLHYLVDVHAVFIVVFSLLFWVALLQIFVLLILEDLLELILEVRQVLEAFLEFERWNRLAFHDFVF